MSLDARTHYGSSALEREYNTLSNPRLK